jgi:hypothetical protein
MLWDKFRISSVLLLVLTIDTAIAGKLFPYGDFFKWLSYGNGWLPPFVSSV